MAALQHRALVPGAIEGVVVVTGAPSGDRAVARVVAGREDVLLQAPGYRPQLGGIYRVTGRLREISTRRCVTTTQVRGCTWNCAVRGWCGWQTGAGDGA